ncbi:hypothetical protein D3C75_1374920 [compost metagenome]
MECRVVLAEMQTHLVWTGREYQPLLITVVVDWGRLIMGAKEEDIRMSLMVEI